MYEVFLRELLEPLGIYDLSEESVSGAEIFALGAGLDTVSQQLERTEREALTATAQEEGLTRREALFARRPAADTPEERRKSIAALLQIDADSLTPETINLTISGCGIRARALEVDTGHVRVIFPDGAGAARCGGRRRGPARGGDHRTRGGYLPGGGRRPAGVCADSGYCTGYPAVPFGGGVLLPVSDMG